ALVGRTRAPLLSPWRIPRGRPPRALPTLYRKLRDVSAVPQAFAARAAPLAARAFARAFAVLAVAERARALRRVSGVSGMAELATAPRAHATSLAVRAGAGWPRERRRLDALREPLRARRHADRQQ